MSAPWYEPLCSPADAPTADHQQCYLGKRRLERAISVYRKTVPGGSADSFDVTWHVYYLDPTAPRESVPLRERMAQRLGVGAGGAERVEAAMARLRAMGGSKGVASSFGARTGSTRD